MTYEDVARVVDTPPPWLLAITTRDGALLVTSMLASVLQGGRETVCFRLRLNT